MAALSSILYDSDISLAVHIYYYLSMLRILCIANPCLRKSLINNNKSVPDKSEHYSVKLLNNIFF